MKSRSPLLVVFLVVLIDLVGFGIVVPMLPLFAVHFGASKLEVGLLAASYSAMQFLFAPLWGRLSDRVGRRPVLLLSIAGGAVAMVGAALAQDLVLLFLARIAAGIAGANIGTAQAVVADVTPPEERGRGMGMIGAAFGLGFILGPAIGGVLGTPAAVDTLRALAAATLGEGAASVLVGTSFAPPFLAAAALGGVNLVVALRILPETYPRERRGQARRAERPSISSALAAPGVGAILALNFLMVAAFGCFEMAFSVFLRERFDWGQVEIGWVFTWIGVVVVAVQGGAIGPLMRRFGEVRLLPVGLVIIGASLIALPAVPGIWALLLATAGVALGNGLNTPSINSLVSRLVARDVQGGILGVHQSLGSLARIVGPGVGGLLYQFFGRAAPLATAGALMLACAGAAAALRGPLARRLTPPVAATSEAAG